MEHIGHFKIHHSWCWDNKYKKLLGLFKHLVVFRAESLFTESKISYSAFSELFKDFDREEVRILVKLDPMCDINEIKVVLESEPILTEQLPCGVVQVVGGWKPLDRRY